MTGLDANEIRIIARSSGISGRDLWYKRSFVGMSAGEAVKRLDSFEKARGGLPGHLRTLSMYSAYYVNGKEVTKRSRRVLQTGDVITFDDLRENNFA